MNRAIVIMYDGHEISDLTAKELVKQIHSYIIGPTEPLMFVLDDKDIATSVVHNVKVKDLVKSESTEIADNAIKVLTGVFNHETLTNPSAIAIRIVISGKQEVRKAFKILGCGEYPYSEKVAIKHGFTKKCLKAIRDAYESIDSQKIEY